MKLGIIFKTIRHDDLDFWDSFIKELIKPSIQKPEYRKGKRKAFTVKLVQEQYQCVSTDKTVKRLDPEEAFSLDDKKTYTRHQSTSYANPSEGYRPPFFGHNKSNRYTLSIGMSFDPNDCQCKRIMLYDIGTVTRPYDFDTIEAAQRYISEKLAVDEYHTSLESLQRSGLKKGKKRYNEVMAKLMWTENCAITVFSNNLESRLLAQVRALDLKNRLEEGGLPSFVKINIYPDFTAYTLEQQYKDIQDALGAKKHLKKYIMALEFLSAPSHADIKIFDDLDNWYDACVLIQKTNPRYLPRFLEKLGMTGTRSQIASCEKMLIFAVRNNQLEVVNILIRHAKLDVNKFDSAGESPLFNAAENGFIEVVNALLTHPRINLNQEKYGKTALYLAAKNKHKDVVESLVKHIIQYSKMNQKDRGLQSQEPCPEVDQWIKILLIYPSLALNSKLFPNKSPFRTTLGDNHQGLAYEQLRENICENINILLAANNQFLNNNGIAHKILKFGPLSFKLYIATCAVFVFYALLTNHGNEQVELGLILAFLALTIGLVQGVAFYQRLPVLKYNYCLPLSDERIQALTKFKESFPILHFINPCISTKLDRLTRFFRSYKKEEFQQQSDAANDIPIKIKSM